MSPATMSASGGTEYEGLGSGLGYHAVLPAPPYESGVSASMFASGRENEGRMHTRLGQGNGDSVPMFSADMTSPTDPYTAAHSDAYTRHISTLR